MQVTLCGKGGLIGVVISSLLDQKVELGRAKQHIKKVFLLVKV